MTSGSPLAAVYAPRAASLGFYGVQFCRICFAPLVRRPSSEAASRSWRSDDEEPMAGARNSPAATTRRSAGHMRPRRVLSGGRSGGASGSRGQVHDCICSYATKTHTGQGNMLFEMVSWLLVGRNRAAMTPSRIACCPVQCAFWWHSYRW